MKSIFMLAGAGALALLASGCAPELDQTGLSPEEQRWAADIKANYGAWEVPESVPRSVRRDDISNQTVNAVNAPVDAPAPAVAPVAPVDAPAPAVAPVAPVAEPAPVKDSKAVAPVAAVDNPAPAMPETYTVVKGDTLGAIARKFYGKASAWKRIQDANADLLKGKDLIRPGMKLQIPRP